MKEEVVVMHGGSRGHGGGGSDNIISLTLVHSFI